MTDQQLDDLKTAWQALTPEQRGDVWAKMEKPLADMAEAFRQMGVAACVASEQLKDAIERAKSAHPLLNAMELRRNEIKGGI